MTQNNSMIDNMTFGADPEVFLMSSQDGNFVAAPDVFPKNKVPVPIDGGEGKYCGSSDNLAFEFTTPPAKHKNFEGVLARGFDYLRNYVEKTLDKEVACLSAEFISIDKMKFSEKSKKAVNVVGCDPFLSAYDQGTTPVVLSPDRLGAHRFAGLHFHIGLDKAWVEDLKIPNWAIVMLMDLFVALPLAALFYRYPTPRTPLYGQLGAYRDTPYGFEYRTLGYTPHYSHVAARLLRFFSQVLTKKNLGTLQNLFSEVNWDALRSGWNLTENRLEWADSFLRNRLPSPIPSSKFSDPMRPYLFDEP